MRHRGARCQTHKHTLGFYKYTFKKQCLKTRRQLTSCHVHRAEEWKQRNQESRHLPQLCQEHIVRLPGFKAPPKIARRASRCQEFRHVPASCLCRMLVSIPHSVRHPCQELRHLLTVYQVYSAVPVYSMLFWLQLPEIVTGPSAWPSGLAWQGTSQPGMQGFAAYDRFRPQC